MSSILNIKNVNKNFGKISVLNDININIDKGDFLVLVGPSGCGKSTLLNCIAGLEKINSGDIFIDNKKKLRVKPVANFESLEFLRILNTKKIVVDWTETDLVGMENF